MNDQDERFRAIKSFIYDQYKNAPATIEWGYTGGADSGPAKDALMDALIAATVYDWDLRKYTVDLDAVHAALRPETGHRIDG